MNATIKFKECDCTSIDETEYIYVIGGGKNPQPTPENMTKLFKQIRGLCLREEVEKLLQKEGYEYSNSKRDDGEYMYTLHQDPHNPLILLIQKEISYTPYKFGIEGDYYHTEYHTKSMIKLREWN